MSQKEFYTYVAILVVLIFVLSIAVSFLYVKVKRQDEARKKDLEKVQKKEQERIDYIIDSLKTIAKAFEQEQVEASEACIRLRMLIDRLDYIENDHFPVIFEMYEELREFKTHEARKALSLQERASEDKQRFAIEDKYMDNFKEECKKLLTLLKVN